MPPGSGTPKPAVLAGNGGYLHLDASLSLSDLYKDSRLSKNFEAHIRAVC